MFDGQSSVVSFIGRPLPSERKFFELVTGMGGAGDPKVFMLRRMNGSVAIFELGCFRMVPSRYAGLLWRFAPVRVLG